MTRRPAQWIAACLTVAALVATSAAPADASSWLDNFRRTVSRPARSLIPEQWRYMDVTTKTCSGWGHGNDLAWVYDSDSDSICIHKRNMQDYIDRNGNYAGQVVIVHEWGHLIRQREGINLDAWLDDATGGEIIGAPDEHEMWAECIARIFAGETTLGYEYRCSKSRAKNATWDALGS